MEVIHANVLHGQKVNQKEKAIPKTFLKIEVNVSEFLTLYQVGNITTQRK